MTDAPRSLPSIAVVTGVGGHADPWHGLAGTSAAIADIVGPVGEVRMTTTDDVAAWSDADLLVLNVSGDLAAPATDATAHVDALLAHHAAGRPILALHSSSLAFRDDARWSELLGGRWVPGVTMHPQIGHALIQVASAAGLPAEIVAFDDDFVLYDERYTHLERAAGPHVLARHTEDGRLHPLVWWRPAAPGRGAVVYDALGHGVESYDSPAHRRWLRATAAALCAAAPRDRAAA